MRGREVRERERVRGKCEVGGGEGKQRGREKGRVKREGERRKGGGWVYAGRRGDEEETNELNAQC